MLMASAKPPPDQGVAQRVRAAIAYGPYSHEQIAQALGFGASQLRRYLRGERSFDEAQLRTIARMCNVSLRLLYEEFPPYGPSGGLHLSDPGSPPTEPRRDQ